MKLPLYQMAPRQTLKRSTGVLIHLTPMNRKKEQETKDREGEGGKWGVYGGEWVTDMSWGMEWWHKGKEGGQRLERQMEGR